MNLSASGNAVATALTGRVPECGMRLLAIALWLSCFAAHAAPPAAPADPVALFEGRSTGSGQLKLMLGSPKPFRVESEGRRQADGAFRLEQRIDFEGEPSRTRFWIIRPALAGRYTFTLSDAAGPGTAEVEGTRFVLRYPLGRGLSMHQVLEPSPRGDAIANTGTVRWLGIPVGRLTETIVRGAAVGAKIGTPGPASTPAPRGRP